MKKIIPPLLLTLTLFSGALSLKSIPVSASAVIDGIEYWSLDELTKLSDQFNSERTAFCGDNLVCDDDYFYENFIWGSDPLARAWGTLKVQRFIISAINPSENKLRIFYNSEMVGSKQYGMGVYPSDLDELYVVWGNPDCTDVSCINQEAELGGIYYPKYVADIKNGITDPEVNILILQSTATDGASWMPSDAEIEVSVPTLNQNSYATLFSYLRSMDGANSGNVYYYSTCLSSPYYQEGMECRFLFGSDTSITYEPFWPGEPTATRKLPEDSDPNQDNLPIETPDGMGGAGNDELAAPSDQNNLVLAPSKETTASLTLESEILAPNTGTVQEISRKSARENLAWSHIVALSVVGFVATIWWFWPKSTKKPRK